MVRLAGLKTSVPSGPTMTVWVVGPVLVVVVVDELVVVVEVDGLVEVDGVEVVVVVEELVVVVDVSGAHVICTFLPADSSRAQAAPMNVEPSPRTSRALGAVMKARTVA